VFIRCTPWLSRVWSQFLACSRQFWQEVCFFMCVPFNCFCTWQELHPVSQLLLWESGFSRACDFPSSQPSFPCRVKVTSWGGVSRKTSLLQLYNVEVGEEDAPAHSAHLCKIPHGSGMHAPSLNSQWHCGLKPALSWTVFLPFYKCSLSPWYICNFLAEKEHVFKKSI
jgi:hypothetical protein